MVEWEKLPDRTTPNGDVLKTERAMIDGEVWFHGTIPAPASAPQPGVLRRLLRRIARRAD